jgi:hypothetical protein
MKKIAMPSLSPTAQRCSSRRRFKLRQLLLGDVPDFSPLPLHLLLLPFSLQRVSVMGVVPLVRRRGRMGMDRVLAQIFIDRARPGSSSGWRDEWMRERRAVMCSRTRFMVSWCGWRSIGEAKSIPWRFWCVRRQKSCVRSMAMPCMCAGHDGGARCAAGSNVARLWGRMQMLGAHGSWKGQRASFLARRVTLPPPFAISVETGRAGGRG